MAVDYLDGTAKSKKKLHGHTLNGVHLHAEGPHLYPSIQSRHSFFILQPLTLSITSKAFSLLMPKSIAGIPEESS